MGLIQVQEYSSAADMMAAYAARERSRQAGIYRQKPTPKPVVMAQRPAPTPLSLSIVEVGKMDWKETPFSFKCKIFKDHYQEGDTFRMLARRISENSKYNPTPSALNGIFYRAKNKELAGITFKNKGGGGAWSMLGKRIKAWENKNPTKEDFMEAVNASFIGEDGGKIDVRTFIRELCGVYGVPATLVLKQCNEERLSFLRHKIMWLARHVSGNSYPNLAVKFERDHTTVIHGVKKIGRLIESEDQTVSELKEWVAR